MNTCVHEPSLPAWYGRTFNLKMHEAMINGAKCKLCGARIHILWIEVN